MPVPEGSPASSDHPAISAEGRFVVFDSQANLTGCKCGEQVYLRDLVDNTTELISASSAGIPAHPCTGCFGEGEGSVSADGRYIAFSSWADNLVPGDTNRSLDVFVRDRLLGETRRVSVGVHGEQGRWRSFNAHLSADGHSVAFWSSSVGLDPRYPNEPHRGDAIYWKDLVTGDVRMVTVASDGTPANDGAFAPQISPDGKSVMFASIATNLTAEGPGPREVILREYDNDNNALPNTPFNLDVGIGHAYVHEIESGRTTDECVTEDGTPVDGNCFPYSVSDGGRYALFYSAANVLPPARDIASHIALFEVYRRDRKTGAIELVSKSSTGDAGGDAGVFNEYPVVRELGIPDPRRPGGNTNHYGVMSPDGRFIAFDTEASLVPEDTNDLTDVYIRDLLTGNTRRISVGENGGQGNAPSYLPSMSADGTVVAFRSEADNLVAGDRNGQPDVYVRL